MKTKIKVCILRVAGTNCDAETKRAFEDLGVNAEIIHFSRLVREKSLFDYSALVFPGGFSYGDYVRAGAILAKRTLAKLGADMKKFIEEEGLVLGICNGFQALVNLGLLPGFDYDYKSRSVALTFNDCGNFRNQWVNLQINPESPCIFTRGLNHVELPVRHGEGKFYSDEATIKRLDKNNQIVVQYAVPKGGLAEGRFPFNPNGSIYDIAGICDPTGRVFGLMPHPEAFNHWTNHPDWTRKKERLKRRKIPINSGSTPGIRMFQNAVDFIRER